MNNSRQASLSHLDLYPARLTISYPDKLSRFSTLFRLIYAIPILIIVSLLSVGSIYSNIFIGTGVLFLPPLFMILFRKKYPHWWFDWNIELTRFQMRVLSYLFLLNDNYPSTDEKQGVDLDLDYPDVENLNRGLPLIKWFLAIPHYVVLIILAVPLSFSVIIAWFAILISGTHPKFLFNFIVGYFRWSLRVSAYAFLLITDKYPPFSLRP